ncbi:MAG: hypothetical protein ACJ79R_10530, partial [Anaeromyxobacteraceae bacterium]
MAVAYSEISRVLDGARRRQGWVVLGTALGWGSAAALVAVLAGVCALGAGWTRSPVRQVTLAAAAIAVVTALAWAAVALMRRASTPAAVARTVGRAAPELRGDLLSSVELEDEYEEVRSSGRFSVAMVDAHISHTAARARGLDLSRVISSRPARHALFAALGAFALHLLALAVAPRATASGWQRLAGGGPAASVRRAEPITGDVELTYVYPAYMGRPARTISGTGGEVNAPKGTEVRLVTRADRPVEAAEIAIEMGSAGGPGASAERAVRPSTPGPEHGAKGAQPGPYAQDERTKPPAAGSPPSVRPERSAAESKGGGANPERPTVKTIALTVKNARDLSGTFLVEEGGSYRFRFTHGKKLLAEGPATPIVVEADAFPEVRVTAPADEVEVAANATVNVEWTASDDVGLRDLSLVVKPPGGEEKRTVLRQFDATRRESGSYALALPGYRLAEGERLLFWLEVTDGDTVSGPKR